MARKSLDKQLKKLRNTLRTHPEFATSANMFFDILEDPVYRRGCERAVTEDVEAMLRAIFHHTGWIGEDEPLLVKGYPPSGFYHGMLAPMVVFFYFDRGKQGLIIQTSFTGKTDYFRFSGTILPADAIPVMGNTTVH